MIAENNDVLQFFKESQEGFTIYVVERRFAVVRGNEFFKSFKGSINYIKSESEIRRMISKILKYVERNIPNIAELIGSTFTFKKYMGIPELLNSLSKLFFTNEHQAAGIEVIDPIIIEEELISPHYISQIVSLHKHSILRPVIIIILKDNNFERAKDLLSTCPHGLNVKLIRNSGETEIFKIINTGALDVSGFLDAFSRHCFSTCSQTKRSVLINNEWSNNSIANSFAPSILKVRSNLLFDEKDEVMPTISNMINELENVISAKDIYDEKLIEGFLCTLKIMNVYAKDKPDSDLKDAYELAKDLEDELLLAHVFRYVDYYKNKNRNEKIECLEEAKKIFACNNVEDHAIYCENNKLIQQFYMQKIRTRDFKNMHEEAIHNVPGLVGMSIICNNTGVSYLYTGKPETAIEYFEKGMDYAEDRPIQYFGLKCNKLIAQDYGLNEIDERVIRTTISEIIDNFGTESFSFITANYLLNLLAIILRQKPNSYTSIINDYPIMKIINNAININQLGSGSLYTQLNALSLNCNQFNFDEAKKPGSPNSQISGIREMFIKSNNYNPTIFNAWL